MKRHLLTLTMTLPALALLGGCGETANNSVDTVTVENAMPEMDGMEMNTGNAMGEAASSAGQQFADTAAASDAYEVAAGNLAKEKATAQALKDFGAMMVTAHTDSTAKLKTAAGAAGITPNPAMTAEQEANLETLRNASGAEFDAAYKAQQITAHQNTLAAMQGFAASGEVAELKAFAAATAPVVQRHLDQIKGM